MRTGHDSNEMRIMCAYCGAANRLVGIDVGMDERVSCSKCGRFLGRWADLADASDNDNGAPKRRSDPDGQSDS